MPFVVVVITYSIDVLKAFHLALFVVCFHLLTVMSYLTDLNHWTLHVLDKSMRIHRFSATVVYVVCLRNYV